jgi:hypothetical protein
VEGEQEEGAQFYPARLSTARREVESFAREKRAAVTEDGPGQWRIERKPPVFKLAKPALCGRSIERANGVEPATLFPNGSGSVHQARELRGRHHHRRRGHPREPVVIPRRCVATGQAPPSHSWPSLCSPLASLWRASRCNSAAAMRDLGRFSSPSARSARWPWVCGRAWGLRTKTEAGPAVRVGRRPLRLPCWLPRLVSQGAPDRAAPRLPRSPPMRDR